MSGSVRGSSPQTPPPRFPISTPDEIEARLAFRIAVHLRRCGEPSAADWFAAAAELAPMDFTVRRAAMPLQDLSPFGEQFFEFYAEWKKAGRPYHGIPR